MKTQRIFLDSKYKGKVVCSQCGNEEGINLASYYWQDRIVGGKTLSVKCPCGNQFLAQVDLRKYDRTTVDLSGKLLRPFSKANVHDVVVVSLSVSGAGFLLVDNVKVSVGEVIELIFALDDERKSLIHEEFIVKHVDGSFVGGEFANKATYNHALDFYMMPSSGEQATSSGEQATS